jgi:hypothetical protein
MGYVGGSIILLNLGSTVFLIYRNKTETAPPTLRGRRGATNPSFRRPVFVATPRRAAAPRAPSVDREGPMKVVAGPLPPPRGLRDGRDRPGPDGPRRWRRRPRIWAASDLIRWLVRLGRVFGVLVVRVAIVRKQWCPVVTRGGLRCFRHRRPAFLRCQPWPAVVGRGWPAALAEAWPWPAVAGPGLAVAWPLSGSGRPWLGCGQSGPTTARVFFTGGNRAVYRGYRCYCWGTVTVPSGSNRRKNSNLNLNSKNEKINKNHQKIVHDL